MSIIINILEYVLLISTLINTITGAYDVSITESSWDLSLFYCRNMFMNLVTIESEMKHRYVQSLLLEQGVSEDIWFDLRLSDGTLADGTLLYEDSNGIVTSYLPWDTAVNEPDKQDSERCVRMARNGYFRTSPCSRLFKYVCVGSQDVPTDWSMTSGDTTTLISNTEKLTTDRSNMVSKSEALSTAISDHETKSTFVTQTTAQVNDKLTMMSSEASSDPTINVTEYIISMTNYTVGRTKLSTISSETTSLLSTISGTNSQNPIPESTSTSFEEGSTNQEESNETTYTISDIQTVIPDNEKTTQTSLPDDNSTTPSGRTITTYSDTVSREIEKDFTAFTCCSTGCNFERFNWSDPEFLKWLSKRLSEIRESLFIDKKNTTTFKNSKRSPMDTRTSSAITGSLGAVLIVILVAAITIPDLLMLMTFLKDKLRATKETTSEHQTQKGSKDL